MSAARFLIRHDNKWRMRWDLLVMLIAIWNCISIPFDVAFDPKKGTWNKVLDTLIDICFFLDIVLTFDTSYVNDKTGFEIFSYKLIAWNYIKNG
jgi:predicted membrane protein